MGTSVRERKRENVDVAKNINIQTEREKKKNTSGKIFKVRVEHKDSKVIRCHPGNANARREYRLMRGKILENVNGSETVERFR